MPKEKKTRGGRQLQDDLICLFPENNVSNQKRNTPIFKFVKGKRLRRVLNFLSKQFKTKPQFKVNNIQLYNNSSFVHEISSCPELSEPPVIGTYNQVKDISSAYSSVLTVHDIVVYSETNTGRSSLQSKPESCCSSLESPVDRSAYSPCCVEMIEDMNEMKDKINNMSDGFQQLQEQLKEQNEIIQILKTEIMKLTESGIKDQIKRKKSSTININAAKKVNIGSTFTRNRIYAGRNYIQSDGSDSSSSRSRTTSGSSDFEELPERPIDLIMAGCYTATDGSNTETDAEQTAVEQVFESTGSDQSGMVEGSDLLMSDQPYIRE